MFVCVSILLEIVHFDIAVAQVCIMVCCFCGHCCVKAQYHSVLTFLNVFGSLQAGSISTKPPSTDIFDMIPFSPVAPLVPLPASNGTPPPPPEQSADTRKPLPTQMYRRHSILVMMRLISVMISIINENSFLFGDAKRFL